MKKVLVTGASGFIGRHCLSLLKARGYDVYAISSKAQSSLNGIQWVQCDLLNNGDIKGLMATIKPSYLLHMAWVTTPGKLWGSNDNLTWLKASIDLIEAFALHGGKRAVFAGTCAEYDWSAAEFVEGKTLCLPRNVYGASKLALHLLLDSLSKQFGFSQAWGRIFYLYGPYEHPQRFVPAVIRGLLQKMPIPCSHGNQIRDFLHVQDVAAAFAALLDSEVQGIVNIGSGVGVSLKKVIETITERLGGHHLIQYDAMPVPQDDPPQLIANTKRLNEEVRWSPNYTFEEGINEAISWWSEELSLTR